MVLLRLPVLAGAGFLLSSLSPADADPLGTGLLAFFLTVLISGLWAALDGWRHPLRTAAAAWVLTAALFVVFQPLPNALAWPADEGGWTGLWNYLSSVGEGAGFVFALVAVPAAAGLALGHLIRRLTRPARLDATAR